MKRRLLFALLLVAVLSLALGGWAVAALDSLNPKEQIQ
jgi:hypothetical protein